MQIDGVAAVVTGGASGLGGAVAKRLAAAGAKVAIFDLNQELGMANAREIGGQFFHVDITDEVAVANANSLSRCSRSFRGKTWLR